MESGKMIDKLIRSLLNFASNPSRDSSKACRAFISSIEVSPDLTDRQRQFLNDAYQKVVRPYQNASSEIKQLVVEYEVAAKHKRSVSRRKAGKK